MKRVLFISLVILVFCGLATACESKNASSNDPIVGTWQMISISASEEQGTVPIEEYLDSARLTNIPKMIFEGGGKVTVDTGETSGSAIWRNENGNYTITDNSNKEEPVVMEVVVNDNLLSMLQDGYLWTFEKQ